MFPSLKLFFTPEGKVASNLLCSYRILVSSLPSADLENKNFKQIDKLK